MLLGDQLLDQGLSLVVEALADMAVTDNALSSTRIIVGHAHTPKRFQVSKLLSCTTGNFMPSRCVASFTLSMDFSQGDSGE
jgi:hypothetical protein